MYKSGLIRKDDKRIHKNYTPTVHFWADSFMSILAGQDRKLELSKQIYHRISWLKGRMQMIFLNVPHISFTLQQKTCLIETEYT